MDEKITPEQAKAAADWWTEQIKNPRFDNGDDSETGGMTMILQTILANKTRPSAEKYDAFRVALEAAIIKQNPRFGLHVDYDPDRVLADVAEATSINPSQFPWKTSMYFRDGGVQVRAGYRAETKEIMAAVTK